MINSRSKIFQNLGNHFSPKSLWPKCERLPPRSFTFSSKRFEHLVKNLPKLLSLRNLPKILYAFPKQKPSKVLLCLDSSTESQLRPELCSGSGSSGLHAEQMTWTDKKQSWTKMVLKNTWSHCTLQDCHFVAFENALISQLFVEVLRFSAKILTENNESSFFYIAERTLFPLKTFFQFPLLKPKQRTVPTHQ